METPLTAKTKVSMPVISSCLGMFLAVPAVAQSPPLATTQDPTSLHHQRIHQLMRDMTREMSALADEMSRGELTPERRRQMIERMARMSTIMRDMSGPAARPVMRPAMSDPESQRQMEQMRTQMDAMMRDLLNKPSAE